MVQSARNYTGVFPVAPTPFKATGDLDLEGQRRVIDCMLDQGVDGICVLANYSEQFLLTDHERDTLTDLCLSHVAGRSPVIVTGLSLRSADWNHKFTPDPWRPSSPLRPGLGFRCTQLAGLLWPCDAL